jgi:hypothetical protein
MRRKFNDSTEFGAGLINEHVIIEPFGEQKQMTVVDEIDACARKIKEPITNVALNA